jgi:hypothetical protein
LCETEEKVTETARTMRRIEIQRDKRRDNKEKWFGIKDMKFL